MITTHAPFPDYSWELILLVAVGMALDGSITTAWLVQQNREMTESCRLKSDLPKTLPVTGWHFTPDDWDRLLVLLESGDMEGIDAAINEITQTRIRRRYSARRIRGSLRALKPHSY